MLNDIALSLFVGLAAGAYSSIFIATPLVADLKERDPQIAALRKRVLAKRAADARKAEEEPQDAAQEADGDEGDGEEHAAAAGVAGPRRQPASRNRGKNRPSGKRH
jgi:preprotein translocase subunit SecF